MSNLFLDITKATDKARLICSLPTLECYMVTQALDTKVNFGVRYRHIDTSDLHITGTIEELYDEIYQILKAKHRHIKDGIVNASKNTELLKAICSHKLPLGVTYKKLNEYDPARFPMFGCQLAVGKGNAANYDYGQLKYDGVRMLACVTPDNVALYTRKGEEFKIPGVSDAIKQVFAGGGSGLCDDRTWWLDGELVIGSGRLGRCSEVSGIVNSAMKTPYTGDADLKVRAFDLVAGCEKGPRDNRTLYDRLLTLSALDFNDVIELAQACEDAGEAIKDGYEGTVLKKLSSVYKLKRSSDWLKVKGWDVDTFTCVGWEEGSGENLGRVGALIVSGVVSGMQITSKVSGLTNEQREWRDHWLGKSMDIRYAKVTKHNALWHPSIVKVHE